LVAGVLPIIFAIRAASGDGILAAARVAACVSAHVLKFLSIVEGLLGMITRAAYRAGETALINLKATATIVTVEFTR
jgi:hypothetical protein